MLYDYVHILVTGLVAIRVDVFRGGFCTGCTVVIFNSLSSGAAFPTNFASDLELDTDHDDDKHSQCCDYYR